jgi:hypothetical protein
MGDPVYLFGAPPLPFGAIDYPVPFASVIYTGVDPVNLGSHEGKAYLLSAAPFDTSKTTAMPAPPLPFGDIDFPLPLEVSWKGASPIIYPAATIGRSSRPTDTPPSLYIPAKLEPAFPYSMELFQGADPTTAGSDTVGVIQLDDPDGELDGLVSMAWDGAPLSILRGEPDADFSAWSVVASVTAAGMLYDRLIKEIQLRDLAGLLNTAPLHGLYYGGTGGIDGDASLNGTIRPYAVGTVFNVTPVLMVASLLVYQVSCSSVRAVTAVKDGGNPLENDGDVADYAALAAATIGVGHYLTCLALGLFRLGGAPSLKITADLEGDNDTISGHGFPSTRGQIARRIATGRGQTKLDDVLQLDGPSFVDLDNRQPGACGFYWSADITKGAALSQVMTGCLGWWFMRLTGLLAVGQCDDPSKLTPFLALSFPAPGSGEIRVGEPSMTDYKTPRRQTFVGWSKNYTVLQTNEVAGVVDLSTGAILQSPTQYASSLDAWAANNYPTGPIVQIDGGFAFAADAQLEADRQQALLRTRRERYSIVGAFDPFGDFVGRIVAITNFNRLGFGATRNFLCVGMSMQGQQVKLELWG